MSDPYEVRGQVRLRPGRDASLRRRHPWIYRGALAEHCGGDLAPVAVVSAAGEQLGIALPGSSGGSLALRMVAFGEASWDREALGNRLNEALRLRHRLALAAECYRLVHAEGDGLGGLVIDIYGDSAVIEVFERAWEPYLGDLGDFLVGEGMVRVLVRERWQRREVRALVGSLPPVPVIVREEPITLVADLVGGQKTGLFLDQRENRRRIASLSAGSEVLNLFSYSAGFAIAALAGGAHRVVNVDASAAAFELARAGYAANGLQADDDDFIQGDAFAVARELVERTALFDVVVVDPPAFARRQGDVRRALAGYKDINLQALRLLRPGGLLLSCSCSALVDEGSFERMLAAAAADSGREVRVLERRGAGPDHPVAVSCPETRHLKAFLCAAMPRGGVPG